MGHWQQIYEYLFCVVPEYCIIEIVYIFSDNIYTFYPDLTFVVLGCISESYDIYALCITFEHLDATGI